MIGASALRTCIVLCVCAFAGGCGSKPRDVRRRDCEVWQHDRQIHAVPFCNNVQFVMMRIRGDGDGQDTNGLTGRVVTWTTEGPSYGPWQTVPEWFVAPGSTTIGY
jgi:hypothetical protein